MSRSIKIDRVLAMVLAIAMIISMLPVSVLAASTSELVTDMGEKSFVVGVPTEFTFTTYASEEDAGKMVLGSFEFSDPDAVEKLEYRESKDGNWYQFYGDFGPATGFPLTDNATSYFCVTFKQAGVYTLKACMKTLDGEVVCSTDVTITVEGKSAISTDIGEKTFVVDEVTEFSFTTMANEDANIFVKGSFAFSDPDAVAKLEYLEANGADEGKWFEFDGDFGPATGFPLTDNATSRFRAAFNKAGTYTLNAYIKRADNDDVLCFTVATVTVKARSEISFGEDSIEIKYSDVNATNSTLIDSVEGAQYSYKSSNEAIVKVNEYGILTPVAVGEATITVTREENAGFMSSSATYTVNVVKGDQNELVWTNSIPESIKWNDPNGFTNTVTCGKVHYVRRTFLCYSKYR